MADGQVALHARAAQVEVAVAQAHLLGRLLLGCDDERRRLGTIENLELGGRNLDLTRRELRVLGPGRPAAHDPAHANDVLTAQRLGLPEHLTQRWVEDDLRNPAAVPHVDEDQPAVIAPAVYPAVELDSAAGVGGGQRSA